MVKISDYTTDAETDAKALAWINRFDVNNATLRDQWIKTVTQYYNGCQPGWSCWSQRYGHYNDGLSQVLADTGGTVFWRDGGSAPSTGVTCPGGSGTVVGAIADHYKALGGCIKFVGDPLTDELGSPDGVGRYNVFQGATIYWTPKTGAHEVHGTIRDKYKELGWETGTLGYPTSDEYAVNGGRRSDFEHGSILWDAATNVATLAGATASK
jgi:hypothetical protein